MNSRKVKKVILMVLMVLIVFSMVLSMFRW
jgi:hypothetical protein